MGRKRCLKKKEEKTVHCKRAFLIYRYCALCTIMRSGQNAILPSAQNHHRGCGNYWLRIIFLKLKEN